MVKGCVGVASGILPDVERRHLAARKKRCFEAGLAKVPTRAAICIAISAGLEARLYGRQAACRYVTRRGGL
jgi:hypothetical protein